MGRAGRGREATGGGRSDPGGRGRRLLHVEGGHAPQLAPIARVVERARPVHGGPVVPDHEIAHAPLVPVHEARLRRGLDQLAPDEPPPPTPPPLNPRAPPPHTAPPPVAP